MAKFWLRVKVTHFFVDIVYENLPLFYTNCQVIGHSMDNCRKQLVTDKDQEVPEKH